MKKDVRLFQNGAHLLGIGHEVRRQITAVELHALDDVEFGVEALGFFNRDHAFIADALHGLGNHLADLFLAIGRDGAYLGDFVRGRNGLRLRLKRGDNNFDSHVDAALQIHRVHAGGNRTGAFLGNRLGQNGGGGGAVAGYVVGLGGNFANHLRAHVLELVLELDVLGDGNAVLGDARCAKRLLKNHVTAFRAECDFHGIGQGIDALEHPGPGVRAKFDFFSSH